VVAFSVTVLSTMPAVAQPKHPGGGEQEAERTKLYKKAVEAANAGRWSEAAETLRAVLAIRSSPKVRFTLGQAEEHASQLLAAYDAYTQAVADAEAAGEPDVVATVRGALQALAPRVPSVRVTVTGTGAGAATAAIDAKSAVLGQPVRVDPGSHLVAVSAPGAKSSTTTISVVEGQQLDVPVALEAEGPASSSANAANAATEGGGGFPWSTAGLIGAGVGVAGLGVGSYFGLDAISKNNASNKSGCNGNDCTAAAFATREAARSSATASTALFVAGAVLAAGGVTLWLLAPHGSAEVEVAPSAVSGGAGVTVAGVWR